MATRPILFNTEMVQAIQAGRKTQTRRLVLPPQILRKKGYHVEDTYNNRKFTYSSAFVVKKGERSMKVLIDKPCTVGDILWVREAWAHPSEAEIRNGADPDMFIYKADSPLLPAAHARWKPSIHMPKEAARIFLRVKDVWVERLKDIYEKYEYGPDHPVAKEGFGYTCDFIATWENTVKPADRAVYGWDANPWVWVIEFERCERPENWKEGKEAMEDARNRR